jgi:hypothetical protein
VRSLRVAPVVEGHGEVDAIRILLQRIWSELLEGEYIEVLPPIRQPKTKLVQQGGLERALKLAAAKLSQQRTDLPALVLVLVDADDDCPAELGPVLSQRARATASHAVECVVANVEYETWFVAAATSLADLLLVGEHETTPVNPEAQRLGKGWVRAHFRAGKYSESVDQARMTHRMDLEQCRRQCPSFKRLCRKLEIFAETHSAK